MLYQVVQSYFFLIVVADLKGLFTNKCMMYTNITLVSYCLSYQKGSNAVCCQSLTGLTCSAVLKIVQSFSKLPKISHSLKLQKTKQKTAHVV